MAIERKSGASRAEFSRDHLEGGGRTVILTDAIAAWPALRKWTFDSLTAPFGRDHGKCVTA